MRRVDNLYYCRGCKKKLWRFAATKQYKSYCEQAGKTVQMVRAKTVKMHLVIDKWLMTWLENRATSLEIGLNECFNRTVIEGIELEKKNRESITS